MRGESIFQKDKLEKEGRFFLLVDALERKGVGLASQEEIETLVTEALSQTLKEKRPLNESALKEAILEANARLRLASKGESTPPIVSVVIAAEGEEGYLLAGVGDARVYGVSKEKTALAFSDPTGNSGKSNQRSTSRKNRLGSDPDLQVHVERISKRTYDALLALNFEAYSQNDKQWEKLTHSQGLAHQISQMGANSGMKGWLLHTEGTTSAPQKTLTPKRRSIALSLALAAIVGASIIGLANYKARTSPLAVEQLPLAAADNATVDYEKKMAELALLFDTELQAQQNLLTEHKTEVANFYQQAAEYEELQEQFLQLSDLLAMETSRVADLEANLEAHHEHLIMSRQAINEQEQMIANLEHELYAAKCSLAELAELEQQHHEQSASMDALQASLETSQKLLSETQAIVTALQEEKAREEREAKLFQENHEVLLSQFKDLSEVARTQEFALAAEKEREEELQLQLAATKIQLDALNQQKVNLAASMTQLQEEKKQQQGMVEETLKARLELTEQLALLSERSDAMRVERENLLNQIATLEQTQRGLEHKLQDQQTRDDYLARLGAQMESWKEAMLALEKSRNDLRQELTELRAHQQMAAQGRQMVAKADVRPPRSTAHVTRVHLVSPGESLDSIAERYYGSTEKAQLIVEANQETLSSEKQVRVGTALVIP
ncbi:MAG: LysM peptidoglycan-binding domain-containing protein [Verrucomicrobia bacterium]|nr:LysM peptidoglycan-binding domain-containing protein [Verrucomicrobiota bacterium]